MKKIIFLLVLVILMAIGCKNEKPSEFTMLPDYTTSMYPEKLVGRVEKMTEKNYWAIPDGEKYKKGNPISMKELDSLGWTEDFEVVFDNTGLLVTISGIDETARTIWVNEFLKENNVYTERKLFENDTLKFYDKLKCDENGNIIEITGFRAPEDTVIVTTKKIINAKGDTIENQWFNNKGELAGKRINIYDDLHQRRQVTGYDKDGNYQWRCEDIYNEKGKPSKRTWYDKEENISSVEEFTYEYDKKGNWVIEYYKDEKNHISIMERTYTYFE